MSENNKLMVAFLLKGRWANEAKSTLNNENQVIILELLDIKMDKATLSRWCNLGTKIDKWAIDRIESPPSRNKRTESRN